MKRLITATAGNRDARGRLVGVRYDNVEGPTRTPEYRSWAMARNRCRNPQADNYQFYGGRGITFSRDFDDFSVFLIEIGPRPSLKHQLERIDNERGYEPGNVQWATRQAQCNNRRTNRRIEFNGQSKTIAEWSRETGIDQRTLRHRLFVANMPIEQVLG